MIETARVKIRKLGNSQGCILPKVWLDLAGADIGDELIISIREVITSERSEPSDIDIDLFDD